MNNDDFSLRDLKSLDMYSEFIKLRQKESKDASLKEYDFEFCEAYLVVMCTSFLSLGIQKKKTELLPAKWIHRSGKPNPNFLLGSMLTLIANHELAVINMLRDGLNNSARVLMRTLFEICAIMIVVISDREKMIAFINRGDNEKARESFFRHFTPK